jgi:hypothetical protein
MHELHRRHYYDNLWNDTRHDILKLLCSHDSSHASIQLSTFQSTEFKVY